MKKHERFIKNIYPLNNCVYVLFLNVAVSECSVPGGATTLLEHEHNSFKLTYTIDVKAP